MRSLGQVADWTEICWKGGQNGQNSIFGVSRHCSDTKSQPSCVWIFAIYQAPGRSDCRSPLDPPPPFSGGPASTSFQPVGCGLNETRRRLPHMKRQKLKCKVPLRQLSMEGKLQMNSQENSCHTHDHITFFLPCFESHSNFSFLVFPQFRQPVEHTEKYKQTIARKISWPVQSAPR